MCKDYTNTENPNEPSTVSIRNEVAQYIGTDKINATVSTVSISKKIDA